MDWLSKNPETIQAFKLFGRAHIITVIIMVILSWMIVKVGQRYPKNTKRYFMVSLILMDLAYRLWGGLYESINLKTLFTLQLSSAAVVLTIMVLIKFNQKFFDVLLYWGLLAVPQAIITPGITRFGFPHLRFFHILWIHMTVMTAIFYLLIVEKKRPSDKSLKRALVATHVYGGCVFIINMIFDTNYMFIGRKTSAATIIDFLGPWPWYILVLDLLVILSFLGLNQVFKLIFKKEASC